MMPMRPKCYIICIFLCSLHQFHISSTLHELQPQCQAAESCGCVLLGGIVSVCVSVTCVSMLIDPSLIPTGTQTAQNRFAVTLSSMRIPTTDWCVNWRRRCLVWKIYSTPRAWVTSLRVRIICWIYVIIGVISRCISDCLQWFKTSFLSGHNIVSDKLSASLQPK